MKNIDLNDWVRSGDSTYCTSYFQKDSKDFMLKLLKPGVPASEIEEEYEQACKVYELGIPSPEPGVLVMANGCEGLMFKRMVGKKSYARALGDEPERAEEFGVSYARSVKALHSTPCDKTRFKSIKETYGSQIAGSKYRDDDFKKQALDFLNSLPDGDTCVHGDMHFGNLLTTPAGNVFIDLGNFSYGNPLFDFAMMDLLLDFGKYFPQAFEDNYHCTVEVAAKFWHAALREFFGPDVDYAAKKKEFHPYMAIRQITIEASIGDMLPKEMSEELFSVFRH